MLIEDLKDEPVKDRKAQRKPTKYDNLREEEMTRLINEYEPYVIKDWPKRPYKTIIIVSKYYLDRFFFYFSVDAYLFMLLLTESSRTLLMIFGYLTWCLGVCCYVLGFTIL